MLEARIATEEIDVDVCYGDFDGSFRTEAPVVEFYKDGERLDTSFPKSMEYALDAKRKFEAGEYTVGEYDEVLIEYDEEEE